eukprot:1134409-Pelagomonas_calceolata.AAC.2
MHTILLAVLLPLNVKQKLRSAVCHSTVQNAPPVVISVNDISVHRSLDVAPPVRQEVAVMHKGCCIGHYCNSSTILIDIVPLKGEDGNSMHVGSMKSRATWHLLCVSFIIMPSIMRLQTRCTRSKWCMAQLLWYT